MFAISISYPPLTFCLPPNFCSVCPPPPRTPDQCPHVVSLLSESFNPHVRCGSAMALGIACTGSGNKEALAIIEPMITDSVPFVQQVRRGGGTKL